MRRRSSPRSGRERHRLLLVVGDDDDGDAQRPLDVASARTGSPRAASGRARPAARRAAAASAVDEARAPAPRAAAGRPRAGAACAPRSPQPHQLQHLGDPVARPRSPVTRRCLGRRRRSPPPSCAGRARRSGTSCWSAARRRQPGHVLRRRSRSGPRSASRTREHAEQRRLPACPLRTSPTALAADSWLNAESTCRNGDRSRLAPSATSRSRAAGPTRIGSIRPRRAASTAACSEDSSQG